MRTITRLYACALSFLCAATAGADVPFKATTLTADGAFAESTTWYTMKLGSAGSVVTGDDSKGYIELGRSNTTLEDGDLWCFVGDDENGYQIYNKEAGAGKVLAAPAAMSGTEGSTAYVLLKEKNALGDYKDKWDFSASTDLSNVEGFYLNPHGTSNFLNNYGGNGKLAFWTGGKDQGSTFAIEFAKGMVEVNTSTGAFTSGNSAWNKTWASTATDPQLTLDAGYNNMNTENGCIKAMVGRYSPQTYTLSVPTAYTITGYSFDFCKASGTDGAESITVTAGGTAYTSTDEDQHIAVSGLEEPTATFVLSGANKGIVLKNFKVEISRSTTPVEPQFEVFVTGASDAVPYRIPAITRAHNGDLIAVADYRYSGGDIGTGKLDLRGRISKDNGQTWGDIFTVVRGDDYPDRTQLMCVGFGDPCIVADRESDRVLMMSCSGDVMFPNGTREDHQAIARFYSEDNGATWSAPEDIAETIYSQFDNSKIGSAKSMFIGSGRIFQSSTVKVGDYYRLYCSVLFKDIYNVNKNYVLYSDDFGGSWSVLGGVDVAPIPSGGDEPKTEELPDGSILCSSRVTGGRYYNIFSFTNSERAEGAWGTMAFSGESNNGVTAIGNSCNGEVMILPALRKSDNKEVYIALQSVPFGSGRTNVGIYYKELESLADFDTPANFARDWDGRHQASYIGSAYSTMTLQADNTIGFLYEESTYGRDFTIVYKNYSLEQITDSLYEYKADVDNNAFVSAGVDSKAESVKANIGTTVGNIKAASGDAIDNALNAYKSAPSKALYEALNATIANAERVTLTSDVKYRLRNSARSNGTLFLVAQESKMTAAALDEANENQLFTFLPGEAEGTWRMYSEAQGNYLGATGAVETEIPLVASEAEAIDYLIVSSMEGLSYLSCQAPTNASYPAVHLAGDNRRLVPWTTGGEASLWYIEPTDIATDIESVETTLTDAAPEVYYDLSGRRVADPSQKGIYVTNRQRKVLVK